MTGERLVGVLSVYLPDPQGLTKRQARTVALLASEGLAPMVDAELDPVPTQGLARHPVHAPCHPDLAASCPCPPEAESLSRQPRLY